MIYSSYLTTFLWICNKARLLCGAFWPLSHTCSITPYSVPYAGLAHCVCLLLHYHTFSWFREKVVSSCFHVYSGSGRFGFSSADNMQPILTHWGRVTHICVGKLTIIGSDTGLSPERRQAIIWTNGGLLLIGPLGTNFSEILIEIQTFSLKKIRLKMPSANCCSFRLGLNVLR